HRGTRASPPRIQGRRTSRGRRITNALMEPTALNPGARTTQANAKGGSADVGKRATDIPKRHITLGIGQAAASRVADQLKDVARRSSFYEEKLAGVPPV